MTARCRLFAGLTLAAWTFVVGATETKRACVRASDRAQEFRAQEQLIAAREQLLLCAQPTCPGPVRKICDEWLRQVEASLPSVVVRLRDAAGHDVSAARVLVDGRLFSQRLDGRAQDIDPGPHTFRFEPEAAPAFDEKLLIVESEKNRIFTATLPAVAETPPPAPAPVSDLPKPPPPPVARPTSPIPAGTWVFGAGGLAALSAFAYFTATGAHDYQGCTQSPCDPGTLKSLDVRRVWAWTTLGVGTASLAGAFLFLATKSPSPVALEVWPGGAEIRLRARF